MVVLQVQPQLVGVAVRQQALLEVVAVERSRTWAVGRLGRTVGSICVAEERIAAGFGQVHSLNKIFW